MSEIERWSPLKVWVYSLFSGGHKRHAAIVADLAPQPGERLLDIGCGLGQLLELAAARGAKVFGIDSSPAMIARARWKVPEATIEVGPAEDIPFPDDSFDIVSAVATFHHWADRDAGLAESVRVLAPGGRLLIVEKALADGTGHGLSPGDATILARRLEEMGFESVRVGEIASPRPPLTTVAGTLAIR